MRYLKELWTLVFCALSCFLCQAGVSAPAVAREAPDRFLRVPAFFITDRNLQLTKSGDVDFGPHRKYVGECKHDPFMGSAYCVVENVDKKELSNHLKDLGWTKADAKDKLGDFKATLLKADDFEKIQTQFYGQVHEEALLTDDKNLLLFAHGYKNTFAHALSTASRLAYNAERPLILYSWPSVAKLRSYTSDENNVEWSQEHFNEVLTHLEKLCKEDPTVKVRLFAHSMGTRLAVRATPLLTEKSYLIEAALICPDVDDGLVKHYARRYLSLKGTVEIRLYMSRRDKALAISQLLHGGYTRLGEQADAIGGWVTKTMAGQNSKTDEQTTKAADAEFADRLAKTKKRMQTIDFTDLDTGLIGHNVPAKLICSMSFTGAPGAGLELIPEDSGQRSKISNMFTRLAKLRGGDDAANDQTIVGTVLRVMKDDAHNGARGLKVASQAHQ
jgi:pimeloyl-ACP methyl ester carboxylesterase